MKTIKKSTEKSLINQFILNFERDTLQKKNKNKRFSFVLTGGKSPLNLYKKLAKSQVDWQNIDLFWGDERYVSQKNKNSNYKLAYDNLIKKIKINKNSVFRINTNNKVISFDYFLLGMGEDGHIASIFPNSKEIKKKFIVKPVFRKDFIRITLSLNVINNSMKIILWLNNKLKTTKYKQLKLLGKEIPVNNLDKRKTFVFRIS